MDTLVPTGYQEIIAYYLTYRSRTHITIINEFHCYSMTGNDLYLYFIDFSELRDYFTVATLQAKVRNNRSKESFILCEKEWGLARFELDLIFNNGTSIPIKYVFVYDRLYGCKGSWTNFSMCQHVWKCMLLQKEYYNLLGGMFRSYAKETKGRKNPRRLVIGRSFIIRNETGQILGIRPRVFWPLNLIDYSWWGFVVPNTS